MAPRRVIQIVRSDDADAFVLIHVVRAGPAPLDLTPTATEGECRYTAVGKLFSFLRPLERTSIDVIAQ